MTVLKKTGSELVGSVMDPDVNPLRRLPRLRRYQTMIVLSVMWTTIFCASFGAWYYYGELMIGHALVITGAFATAFIFRTQRKDANRVDS